MILRLRKRHLYVWIFLGLFLPIGFIAALRAIPEVDTQDQELPSFGLAEALPEVVASKASNSMEISLLMGDDPNQKQLEIHSLQAVKNPAATLYIGEKAVNSPDQGVFLGQLGSKGIQRISLDSTLSNYRNYHVLVYDPIKKVVIEQVSI